MSQSILTKNKIKHIDWRDVHLLEHFINPSGKILPRKMTGVKAKTQKQIEKSIKRARFMALIPYIKK